MSLVINHNLMAMNAARNLGSAFGDLSTSVRRLSSGLRVSTAADDAAGLAVRELMRSDIAGLNQGIRNANDAISLIQTADGALSIIDEKLIRMKELAMQAATGTYNSDQRLIIDSEYQAMASEITRIANATDFNGLYLLNGALSGNVHDGSGLASTGKLKVHFGTGNDCAEDYYYIQIGTATASALGFWSQGSGTTEAQYVAQHGLKSSGSLTLTNALLSLTDEPSYWGTDFDGTQTINRYYDPDTNHSFIFATRKNGDTWVLEYDPGPASYVSDQNLSSAGGSASSISTQELAQKALSTINNAIISKDNIRAHLGALQNRLQNTISNLQIQSENLQAAESQISDVDVAQEMTEFVRQQILSQSAVAMLAQANSLPRLAMQLLGG